MINRILSFLITIVLVTLCGCANYAPMGPSAFPIMWGKSGEIRGICILIMPRNEWSFKNETMRVKRKSGGLESICLDLMIYNNTDKDIYLMKYVDNGSDRHPVSWKTRTVTNSEVLERVRHGPGWFRGGVGGETYDLLRVWPGKPGEAINFSWDYAVRVNEKIFLPENIRDDLISTEIELILPLKYYVMGASEPIYSKIIRNMRIEYTD